MMMMRRRPASFQGLRARPQRPHRRSSPCVMERITAPRIYRCHSRAVRLFRASTLSTFPPASLPFVLHNGVQEGYWQRAAVLREAGGCFERPHFKMLRESSQQLGAAEYYTCDEGPGTAVTARFTSCGCRHGIAQALLV